MSLEQEPTDLLGGVFIDFTTSTLDLGNDRQNVRLDSLSGDLELGVGWDKPRRTRRGVDFAAIGKHGLLPLAGTK